MNTESLEEEVRLLKEERSTLLIALANMTNGFVEATDLLIFHSEDPDQPEAETWDRVKEARELIKRTPL